MNDPTTPPRTTAGPAAWAAIGLVAVLATAGVLAAHASAPRGDPPTSTARLDLNTATAAELALIPGVGATTAERIVAYRDRFGGFRSMGQLQRVRGIGPRTAATIAQYAELPGAAR